MNDKAKRGIFLVIFIAITPIMFILAPLPRDYSGESGFSRTSIACQDTIAASDTVNTLGNSTDIKIYQGITYVADKDNGVITYDISDTDTLSELDSLSAPSNVISVTVNGRILALGTDGAGVRLINASNPRNLNTISSETSASKNLDVEIEGNYLYTASGSDGFTIVDISDIENPAEIASIGSINNALDVEVEGSYAFIAAGSQGIHIINMFDRTAPYIIETVATTFAYGLKVNGHHIYVADASGFLCIDAHDYNSPTISYTSSENLGFTAVDVMDNYVFATNEQNTTVFDVTTAYNIEKMPYNLTGGYKISIEEGLVGIANGVSGFSITAACDYFEFSSDYQPALTFSLLGDGTAIEVFGDIAYVSTLRSGLRIMNISEIPVASSYEGPEYNEGNQIIYNTSQIGYWKGAFDLTDLELRGNIAYITSEGKGFFTVNVSDPSDPKLIGSFTTLLYGDMNNEFDNLVVDGDVAYMVAEKYDKNSYIISVNITNPANMELLDAHKIDMNEWSSIISKIYVENDYLWAAYYPKYASDQPNATIAVYDITDPANLNKVSEYNRNNIYLEGTALSGRYVYMTEVDVDTYEQTLRVVNFTDVHNPQSISTRDFDADLLQYELFAINTIMTVSSQRLFVGIDLGVLIYDITDPTNFIVDQYLILKESAQIISTGNRLYSASNGYFSLVKIMNGQMNDVDGDGFGYLQERALGINDLKLDSDGDGLNDSIEIYYGLNPNSATAKVADKDKDTLTDYNEIINAHTDPTIPDVDGDGYSDGAEYTFGTDPQNPALYPSKIYGYGLIGIGIVTALLSIISLIAFIKAFKKPFKVRVFISHSSKDYERYKLKELGGKIDSAIKQSQHYKWLPDLKQDSNNETATDEVALKSDEKDTTSEQLKKGDALKDSQILLFLATDETLHSEEAKQQLAYARENELFVVPIKSESVEWGDMATLELNRDLGVEFKMETFEESSDEVLKFIKNFQNDLTNIRDGFAKNKITFVNFAERNYDLSTDMIYQTTKHLVKDGELAGAWTKDKRQFLNAKEIKKRIKKIKKFVKTDDVTILAKKIGISDEYVPMIPQILNVDVTGEDKQ